jgi:hypothetical protein
MKMLSKEGKERLLFSVLGYQKQILTILLHVASGSLISKIVKLLN